MTNTDADACSKLSIRLVAGTSIEELGERLKKVKEKKLGVYKKFREWDWISERKSWEIRDQSQTAQYSVPLQLLEEFQRSQAPPMALGAEEVLALGYLGLQESLGWLILKLLGTTDFAGCCRRAENWVPTNAPPQWAGFSPGMGGKGQELRLGPTRMSNLGLSDGQLDLVEAMAENAEKPSAGD